MTESDFYKLPQNTQMSYILSMIVMVQVNIKISHIPDTWGRPGILAEYTDFQKLVKNMEEN